MTISEKPNAVLYRKCYEVEGGVGDQHFVRLSDRQVVFGKSSWEKYLDLGKRVLRKDANKSDSDAQFLEKLRELGVAYNLTDIPVKITGVQFYDEYFEPILTPWLYKAFSHQFWDLMLSGKGSSRLYAGWLFELYHYTKNANRHMPLAAAECKEKAVKTLLAKHYVEEWNHYDFFAFALRDMGFKKEEIEYAKPLPMSSEMSNFMREAARRDSLAYAICSAVLEGSTVDRKSYNPFYEAVQQHYGVPRGAVQPIYDHLALDLKYQHANLFREICEATPTIDAERASMILSYGYQMVEHIWLWTDNIWKYYKDENNPIPNRHFDINKD